MNRLKFFLAATAILVAAPLGSAETTEEIAELFGRADAAGDAEISPDGRYVTMFCSPMVKRSICIFDTQSQSDPIIVPPLDQARFVNHYWANTSKIIIDIEIFETLRVSSGMKDFEFQRAVSFDVTTKKPVLLMKQYSEYLDTNDLAAVLPSDPKHVLFDMYVWRAAGPTYEVMKVDLDKGTATTVDRGSRSSAGAIYNANAEIAAEMIYQLQPNKLHNLQIVAGGKTLMERKDLSHWPVDMIGLDAPGKSLVIHLDEPGQLGYFRLGLTDGKQTPINLSELGEADTVYPLVDMRTRAVIGFQSDTDRPRQTFEDPVLSKHLKSVSKAFPNSNVSLTAWTDDRSKLVVRTEKPGAPADVYVLDTSTSALSMIGNEAEHLLDRKLGTVEAVTYKAADGLEIGAYLTLPPGKSKADGPFPFILLPHGGPETHDTLTFDWWTQAYASAGYAVLQPNFRGSTGYGKKFLEAGYGEFGGKMVSDVLDGATWAVAQGLAKSGEICAVGASYGGYSALMLALDGASQIKCAVGVNAVTNPRGMLSDLRRGGFTENYWERYMGASVFDEAQLKRMSPTARVGEFKRPILLIAGKEDVTVPFEQSEGIMRVGKSGGKISLHALDGEDHYLSSTRARYEVLSKSLAFLDQHLPAK